MYCIEVVGRSILNIALAVQSNIKSSTILYTGKSTHMNRQTDRFRGKASHRIYKLNAGATGLG